MFNFLLTRQRKILLPLLIILITVAVFSWLQSTPALADPDSFYHAKISVMMRDFGIIRDFPWTQNSLYRELFIDHHFLYHILLIPFVSFTDPLIGLKFATILFASFSVLTIIWLLFKQKVRWLWLWLLLLLTSAPFIFRLSLGKAPSLAIGVTIIGFYFIITKRPLSLFVWTWLFVWFYSAWPLLILILSVYTVVEALWETYQLIKTKGTSVINYLLLSLKAWWSRPNRLLWLAVLTGIISGLIINPYFPTNLFYLKQLFAMSLVGYYKFVGVGAEWYPWHVTELVANIAIPLLVWLVAVIFFFINFKKQSKLSWTALLLTTIFLLYSIKARRQVEYFIPFSVISSALICRDILVKCSFKTWRREFVSWLPLYLRGKFFIGLICLYLIIILPIGLGKGLITAYKDLANGFALDHLKNASQWLANNSQPQDIVFQSDWGTFPLLFYYNTHNYYQTGLDQTFMYEYDKEKYQQWVDTTKGRNRDVYQVATKEFKASWLLLEKRKASMLKWINRDKQFVQVYQDDRAIIFKL